jgi:hypothetical protein
VQQVDTKWDEAQKRSTIKNWRDDVHQTHPHSHSIYSHYAQASRTKTADAPRWPAREAVHSSVHRRRADDEPSLTSLPRNKWWANSKEQVLTLLALMVQITNTDCLLLWRSPSRPLYLSARQLAYTCPLGWHLGRCQPRSTPPTP